MQPASLPPIVGSPNQFPEPAPGAGAATRAILGPHVALARRLAPELPPVDWDQVVETGQRLAETIVLQLIDSLDPHDVGFIHGMILWEVAEYAIIVAVTAATAGAGGALFAVKFPETFAKIAKLKSIAKNAKAGKLVEQLSNALKKVKVGGTFDELIEVLEDAVETGARVAPTRMSLAERQAMVAARTPEEVAARLARANDLRRVRDGIPSRLYHYTDEAGEAGIRASDELFPSLKAVNPKDARYGDGQYLTDIVPGTRTPAELSYDFLRIPFQGRRFTNFVEIDVSGLRVIRGRDGVFVVPNTESLPLTGRIMRSGAN